MTNDFITLIGPIIQAEAKARGYKYPSAIIAQACLESNFGKSVLASQYHNYFGMKCGSRWTGKSVNLSTKEECFGNTISIRDNFRVYDNVSAGVKGYFDFISASRYLNLKSATSPRDYLEKIKTDGYATSTKYVESCYNVYSKYNLKEYDNMSDNKSNSDLTSAINVIADYVIKGYFGNGHDTRKENIYKMVREAVNGKLK